MTELYISSWEFVTNLGFEWSIIRGRRPYRWTIWVCHDKPFFLSWCPVWVVKELKFFRQIYALTRLSALMTVIINLILLNNTTIISCQVCAIPHDSLQPPYSDLSPRGLSHVRNGQ